MDAMEQSTLEAMKGADGPTVPVVKKPVTDEPQQQPMTTSYQPEGSRTWNEPAPQQVSSYAERSAQAMNAAFRKHARVEDEIRADLARKRASGELKDRLAQRTSDDLGDTRQKGAAYAKALGVYMPEPKDEPALDNLSGPGPTILIEDNQTAMRKLFTIGSFNDGTRVVGDEKGIRLA